MPEASVSGSKRGVALILSCLGYGCNGCQISITPRAFKGLSLNIAAPHANCLPCVSNVLCGGSNYLCLGEGIVPRLATDQVCWQGSSQAKGTMHPLLVLASFLGPTEGRSPAFPATNEVLNISPRHCRLTHFAWLPPCFRRSRCRSALTLRTRPRSKTNPCSTGFPRCGVFRAPRACSKPATSTDQIRVPQGQHFNAWRFLCLFCFRHGLAALLWWCPCVACVHA